MANYFTDAEFHCKCGRSSCDRRIGPSSRLRMRLNTMRETLGRPIIIRSGNRCDFWNQHEGGVKGSEHDRETGCEGADLQCLTSADRWAMIDAARLAGFVRIGIGKTFLHVGVGATPDDVQNVAWTYYPKKEA